MLSDLKDKIIELFSSFISKIQENPTYIQVHERYRNLSPATQKLVMGAAVFLVLFTLYTIPEAFVVSSSSYEESFQTNRRLIRDLFRTSRNPVIQADQFRGLGFDEMKSMVESQLTATQIIDSQKGPFTPVNNPLPKNQVPGAIQQTGMSFQVKKMNLTQVVQLSQKLSALHANTKLAGVNIQADREDPHYFDVTFTLSSLSLPMKEDAPVNPKKKR